MDKITIIKDKGTPTEQNIELETEGFILVYTDKAKVKVTGSLDLRMFTPLVGMAFKYFAQKMKSS